MNHSKIAESRGCARIDLSVLDWNPARDFYQRLGFRHADVWQIFRLGETNFAALRDEAADFVIHQ